MVKIDLNKNELEALDYIISKTECPVKIGFILGSLRIKIQQSINIENEKAKKDEVKT